MKRSILFGLVFLVLTLPAFADSNRAQFSCPAPLAPFVKVTLYMDLSNNRVPNGWIDEDEQRVLRREVLQPRLRGAAMWESRGWWTRPDGTVATGPGLVITHTRPFQERAKVAASVSATIEEITERYGQSSVLWEEHEICARF
ncbi:MAG: hypothetical protein WEB88_17120 [Gemmatimonadota bacterium]